jgi:16S rRNA (cytosine967-C5)-methyltransferase
VAASPALPRPDQALLRELATGVLRWRGRLDYAIEQAAGRPVRQLHPLVLDLLRLSAYQLLFLDRMPPSAAVNESVKLAKARRLPPALTAFVNAVGRTLAAGSKDLPLPDPETAPIASLAAATSLPEWLAARWLADLGRDAAWARAQANNLHPPLTIRVNTTCSSPDTLRTVLQEEGVETEPCLYSPLGLTIRTLARPPLSLPSYQRGLWLFQDEAAQLATLLLQPQPGQQILEIGAGRGGKTTHLAQILRGQGRILALDHSQTRLTALSHNLQRMRLTGVDLLLADAAASLPFRLEHRCHHILIDAPCSGLGVLRRHPELRWRRQPEDFARFALLQKSMLQQAAPYVQPGGVILYITCTTEVEENEAVVRDFLASQPDFALRTPAAALPPQAQKFIDTQGYFRTRPERDGLDGFFAAALIKKGVK